MDRWKIVFAAALLSMTGAGGQARAQSADHLICPADPRDFFPVSVIQCPDRKTVADSYPKEAVRDNLLGSVRLTCVVDEGGGLKSCHTSEETPSGRGFAASALSLAPYFRMAPTAKTGSPAAGTPISFRIKYPPPVQPEGYAVMQCTETAEGTVANCVILSEVPAGQGLGEAALRVAKYFKMKPPVEGRLFKRRIVFKTTP